MAAFQSHPTLRRVYVETCSWNANRGRCPERNDWRFCFAQLTAALFRESNPAPLKYALSLLGLMSPKVRLPLVELTNPTKAELTGILAQVCDGYSVSMIGKICGQAHSNGRHANVAGRH